MTTPPKKHGTASHSGVLAWRSGFTHEALGFTRGLRGVYAGFTRGLRGVYAGFTRDALGFTHEALGFTHGTLGNNYVWRFGVGVRTLRCTGAVASNELNWLDILPPSALLILHPPRK